MKITDYALVFIGITLPFILMAYITIAITIRTYEQEMYYQTIIDGAVEDSLSEMKRIENNEITNDFGYSGNEDNKVSINANVAVSTFFDSFYNSLNLYADTSTQELIQLYVPVIAVMDYNGIYISSIEEFVTQEAGQTKVVTKHVLKPKRYYTYTYGLDKNGKFCTIKNGRWVIENKVLDDTDDSDAINVNNLVSMHNIEFTTDDRIFDTVYVKVGSSFELQDTKEFYIEDDVRRNETINNKYEVNNTRLVIGYTGNNKDDVLKVVIDNLKVMRKEVIANIVLEELSYAANKNNEYAAKKGIQYHFAFSISSTDEMYNYAENIGMIALVQGIRVGNRYLNYKAYNFSDLNLSNLYYCTAGSENFSDKLYHKTKDCTEYLQDIYKHTFYTKEEAAKAGYYPCPVCNP